MSARNSIGFAAMVVLCAHLGSCVFPQTDALLDDLARTTLDAQRMERELLETGAFDGNELDSNAGTGDSNQVHVLGQRVQAFVAKYPDKPKLTVPMQVRMGWLYTLHGFDGLAKATFEDAKANAAQAELSETQEMILENYQHFAWWYPAAKRTAWSLDDETSAKLSIEALGEAAKKSETPEIAARLYLMRVRQASKLVLVLDENDPAVGGVEEALGDLLNFYGGDEDRRRALIATRRLHEKSCDLQENPDADRLEAFEEAMRPEDTDKRRELRSLTRTTFEVFCQTEGLQKGYVDQIGLARNTDDPPLIPVPPWMICKETLTPPDDGIIQAEDVTCAPNP